MTAGRFDRWRVGAGEEAPWDPWAAAEAAGVEVRFDQVADLMGGGLCALHRGQPIVVLSPSLGPSERRCVLAHELVHLERGTAADHPGMPAAWAAVVGREEVAVDHEVARRLVPFPVVDQLLDEAGASGFVAVDDRVVTDLMVESLGVTVEVAQVALDRAMLRRHGSR